MERSTHPRDAPRIKLMLMVHADGTTEANPRRRTCDQCGRRFRKGQRIHGYGQGSVQLCGRCDRPRPGNKTV